MHAINLWWYGLVLGSPGMLVPRHFRCPQRHLVMSQRRRQAMGAHVNRREGSNQKWERLDELPKWSGVGEVLHG